MARQERERVGDHVQLLECAHIVNTMAHTIQAIDGRHLSILLPENIGWDGANGQRGRDGSAGYDEEGIVWP